jgi:3'5'-cyclic nucleotide phosphodiesterase
LAIEDDRLAVLYNDQSMAENWSLYVGFSELLQDEFTAFRKAVVSTDEEYRRFRRMVITMVLTTDIASPERTQVGKSKWKEAFGDPFETVERKMRETARIQRRGSAMSALSAVSGRITEGDDRNNNNNNVDHDNDQGSYSITPDDSVAGADDDESQPNNSHDNMMMMQSSGNVVGRLYKDYNPPDRQKFERRMSATSSSSRFRQRLGILRTVDLSGETLETFQRRGSLASLASTVGGDKSGSTGMGGSNQINAASIPSLFPELDDEPDDLKVSVVMDTLLTAADVAHNLQGWENMVRVQ